MYTNVARKDHESNVNLGFIFAVLHYLSFSMNSFDLYDCSGFHSLTCYKRECLCCSNSEEIARQNYFEDKLIIQSK